MIYHHQDTSDDGYLKRHKKYEDSERKRKRYIITLIVITIDINVILRWDLQRARSMIQHQYLLDRYKRIHEKTLKPTNQKAPKPVIDTLLPKPQTSKQKRINKIICYACICSQGD